MIIKKLKTAVIGIGNMGRHHARVLSQISRLVAVSDVNPKGKLLADTYKINFYENYREMLRTEKINAVIVAVPTKYHLEIAIHTLNHKYPTLLEKPIAMTVNEGKKICDISKKTNTYLQIGHIERYNPAIAYAKQKIKRGELGYIFSLVALRIGMDPPKVDKSDVSLDLAIHDVDIFNYLLGEYPIEINISRQKLYPKNKCDSASMFLKYKNSTGLIQTNWITPIKMRKLFITGSKGFMELDYIQKKTIFYKKNYLKNKILSFNDFIKHSKSALIYKHQSSKEPLKLELEHFLKNVKSGYCQNDLNDALHALKIVKDKIV